MKKSGLLLALLIFAGSCAIAQGTSPVLQNIVTKLKNFGNNHIIEKAYLGFDLPYYDSGDTLYFKAYLLIGERHEVSQASGVLRVDLIGVSNNIIKSRILKISNGTANGDFNLPDTLKSGIYRIRAFTRYMQNAPEYFFDKSVYISGNGSDFSNIDMHQGSDPDIQFFPEGGELVNSVMSRVAFKAIGVNGLGIKAKGTIIDNTNAPVAEFTSNDLGMGSFFIQPEDGKTYKAKVTYANGKQALIALPQALAKGILLRIKDTLGKVSVDIVCNKAYLQDNMNKDVNLIIYSGGALRQVNTKLDSKEMGLDVPESQFPSGVLRVTLFSQEGEPLSERLVFLQNTDILNISVNSSKPAYKTRELVGINVNAKSNGAPVAGLYSAAVLDETKVPFSDNDETTILSYLLLSSELKGFIEKPNYYFAQSSANTKSDLDVLMLTQGYRKFTWKQLSDDTSHFTFPGERALSLSGYQKNSAGAPIPDHDVILLAEKTGGILSAKTDKQGKFNFDNIDFEDGTLFTLQATGSTKEKKSSALTLNVENEPAVASKTTPVAIAEKLKAYAERKSGNDLTMAQGNANADQDLSGADISGSATLTDALKSHVKDINFISGAPYLKEFKYPMLIVVDGKISNNYSNLDNLSPSNISAIQVLKGKNAASFGANGNSGVLVINTRFGSASANLNTQNDKAKSKVTRIDDAHYRSSSIAGPGHADQVIHSDAFSNATSLATALNGRLTGVDFVDGVPYLRGGSVVTGGGGSITSLYIIVDGTPLGHTAIENINPHSVETVELLRGANASIYGSEAGSGVLVITTRIQGDAYDIPQASLGNLRFKGHGFYKAREFYSPKYFTAAQGGTLDQRSTIYWNPNLTTDANGNGSFEFYNADGKGSYRVIVEGMDGKGNIGWQVYRYKVE